MSAHIEKIYVYIYIYTHRMLITGRAWQHGGMKRSSDCVAGGAGNVPDLQWCEWEEKLRLTVLWRRGLYCDVQLRVGTEVFPAHQVVLTAESTFLATLLAGQFKDSLAPIVPRTSTRQNRACLRLQSISSMTAGVKCQT